MDYRKIIEFGKGSYVVTIPKSWMLKNSLKKGEILTVLEGLNDITFSTSNQKLEPEQVNKTIIADSKELKQIETEIVTAYLNSADTIEVLSKNLKTNAQDIKKILRNLSGMEVLEQTSTRIVAKNLINVDEISILTLIRRMDIITRGMIEDSIKCFEEDQYESVQSRDWDVNRLFYLAYRTIRTALKDHRIAKKFNTSPLDLQNYLLMILRIEKTADRQKRIAREIKKCKINQKIKEELKKLYKEINSRYLDIMKAFYTKNKDLAIQVEITNLDRIKRLNFLQDKISDHCCVRIIENLKATTSEIRSMAKTVMGME